VPILRKREGLTAAQRSGVRAVITRAYAGENPRPSPAFDRLDDREQAELLELCERSRRSDGEGADPRRLDAGDFRRFEQLVAKSSGWSDDHFARRREQAVAAAQTAREDADARRLRLSKSEISNLFPNLYRELADHAMWADDLSAICALLTMFSTGRTFVGSAHFEGAGEQLTLVFDSNMGLLGSVDGEGSLDGLRTRLVWLHENGWLGLERPGGPIWRVRLGKRLFEALGGPLERNDDEEVT
jgi:hypothetical protein